MNELTYEEWENKYRPIKNHIVADDDTISFETYGDEVLFVCEQPNDTVWTEMDGDDGVYIVAGYHLANRICYYVTEIPWTDEDYVTVAKFVTCPCYNEETDEANPDCQECYGDGNYTDWK
jgi:hypothetical protein